MPRPLTTWTLLENVATVHSTRASLKGDGVTAYLLRLLALLCAKHSGYPERVTDHKLTAHRLAAGLTQTLESAPLAADMLRAIANELAEDDGPRAGALSSP